MPCSANQIKLCKIVIVFSTCIFLPAHFILHLSSMKIDDFIDNGDIYFIYASTILWRHDMEIL